MSPSPTAGTTEGMPQTMTAEDANELGELSRNTESVFPHYTEQAARILATYHALAASQGEVERLRTALLSRAIDTLPLGATIIKTDVLDALSPATGGKTNG